MFVIEPHFGDIDCHIAVWFGSQVPLHGRFWLGSREEKKSKRLTNANVIAFVSLLGYLFFHCHLWLPNIRWWKYHSKRPGRKICVMLHIVARYFLGKKVFLWSTTFRMPEFIFFVPCYFFHAHETVTSGYQWAFHGVVFSSSSTILLTLILASCLASRCFDRESLVCFIPTWALFFFHVSHFALCSAYTFYYSFKLFFRLSVRSAVWKT